MFNSLRDLDILVIIHHNYLLIISGSVHLYHPGIFVKHAIKLGNAGVSRAGLLSVCPVQHQDFVVNFLLAKVSP